MKNEAKPIAIGVPCYHAHTTVSNLLSSVLIQSKRDLCVVILANDDPKDNGTYDKYKTQYPDIDIVTVDCESNGGPGVARQRAFDKASELQCQWITFMDADDVFFNMFSVENLINNTTPNCVEVMGAFCQEVEQGDLNAAQKMQIAQSGGQIPPRIMPRNDVGHPLTILAA